MVGVRQMKILFPDIHFTLTQSFCKSCEAFGASVIVPSQNYSIKHRSPVGNFVWNESWNTDILRAKMGCSNASALDKQQILDEKPDVIFVTAYENQFEVLSEIWPKAKEWGAKLVFYSGNDYWDTAYPWDLIQNYLCADQLAYGLCQVHQVNYLKWCPWIDYDKFSFSGTSDERRIGCYIANYHETFPADYETWLNIAEQHGDVLYTLASDVSKADVLKMMQLSSATIHLKRLEGYGFAIIESLACGRPVFLYSPYTFSKSYLDWCLHGETAFYFNCIEEYMELCENFLTNQDMRHKIQNDCAKRIRQIVNNEEQICNLKQFLHNLK